MLCVLHGFDLLKVNCMEKPIRFWVDSTTGGIDKLYAVTHHLFLFFEDSRCVKCAAEMPCDVKVLKKWDITKIFKLVKNNKW